MWCHPMCVVVFGSPYMYMRDAIFMRTKNQYCLDEKSFIINSRKGKSKISLVSSNQSNKMIISSRKFVLFFLGHNQRGY
uniref:Uncharacterized protein n=1 Tax=Picea glauca TaxID=3330 RepID=A0A101M3T5_PICGL|nr:hypothetical protein ABT39_MTgene390 [Picea glauca]QHR92201.1 hypothetical protein Q903MT_gene6238 [Picea sitchensis]